jgi:signal transduction histidine kinase
VEALDEQRLRTLIGVGRSLVAELDLDALLERVLEVACEVTGARYAAIGVLGPDQNLERFVTRGIDERTRERIGDLPRGRGVLGLLIEEPRPIRLSNVGSHPRSYGFPAGHPPMSTFLGVPIHMGPEAWGNLYLTEKAGGEDFDQADEESAVVLADWAAIAIQNARAYQESASHRVELERAVAELEATAEIALAVGGETDLGRVLELIVKRARALVGARSLVILLEDREELEVAATAGIFARDIRGERLRVSGSSAGDVLRRLESERVSDVSSRLRISADELGTTASAALLVPLVFHGRALGVMVAFDRLEAGPEFTARDEELINSFAVSASNALVTAKTVAEQRLRNTIEAAENERRRWARELHDETLQGLGALRLILAAGLRNLESAGATPSAPIARAIEQVEDEISKLRGLISELRPATLDQLGLSAAIEELVSVRSGADFEIRADLDLAFENGRAAHRLASDVENTVYRLVQEALTNVAKHAAAGAASISVGEHDGWVEIVVDDDGVGFEPRRGTNGFGLEGMRERVEMAGGTLSVASQPGDGTRLTARIPAVHEREFTPRRRQPRAS